MGRVTVCTLLFTVLLLHFSRGAHWLSGPQDGATEYACAGSSLTLPWEYSRSPGDTVHDIQWFYTGRSRTVKLIAFFSGSFVPLPAFSHRVQFVANGGLQISQLTVADSGKYSVEVSGADSSGAVITLRRSVFVQVQDNDTLMTSDGDLHMTQTPTAVLDTTSNQWTIELRCGHFTFWGQPPFDLQWITPSGTIYSSSEYREGQFLFHLPTPVTGGTYTCRVSAQSAHVCLSADREASLTVDFTTAKFAIIDAKQAASEARLTAAETRLTDSEAKLTASEARLTASEAKQAALQAENDRLKQELDNLKSTTPTTTTTSSKAAASSTQSPKTQNVTLTTILITSTSAASPTTPEPSPMISTESPMTSSKAHSHSTQPPNDSLGDTLDHSKSSIIVPIVGAAVAAAAFIVLIGVVAYWCPCLPLSTKKVDFTRTVDSG